MAQAQYFVTPTHYAIITNYGHSLNIWAFGLIPEIYFPRKNLLYNTKHNYVLLTIHVTLFM